MVNYTHLGIDFKAAKLNILDAEADLRHTLLIDEDAARRRQINIWSGDVDMP